jgi:hypothetical protein
MPGGLHLQSSLQISLTISPPRNGAGGFTSASSIFWQHLAGQLPSHGKESSILAYKQLRSHKWSQPRRIKSFVGVPQEIQFWTCSSDFWASLAGQPRSSIGGPLRGTWKAPDRSLSLACCLASSGSHCSGPVVLVSNCPIYEAEADDADGQDISFVRGYCTLARN